MYGAGHETDELPVALNKPQLDAISDDLFVVACMVQGFGTEQASTQQ
jgi:hypothetical protein